MTNEQKIARAKEIVKAFTVAQSINYPGNSVFNVPAHETNIPAENPDILLEKAVRAYPEDLKDDVIRENVYNGFIEHCKPAESKVNVKGL